ncbi:helicase [Dictyobacter alpinus]|uniref:Helicase n=1 Tax=Dictyobacter alpinus TaxID=2014873 RepID=A0A402BHS7_9CHLR|nr:ABC transporter ATP-binding protein [Dictyobacter alpinus]GCE30807.1 helicase [Dictyobacter alpinus]
MHTSLKRYLTLLSTYLKPQWRNVVLLALALCSGIGLQLLNPQILGHFIDTAVAQGANTTLVKFGLLFIGISIAKQGISVLSTYLDTHVAWTATNQLRSDLVAHCLSLDMHYHKTRSAGEMIERIDGDVNALTNFFSQLVLNLLTSLILLLCILILFFAMSWQEGCAMTIFSGIAFLILMRMRKHAIPIKKKERQITTTFYGFLSERLSGTEDIRANGANNYVLHQFYLLLSEWFPIFRRSQRIGASMGIISLMLFVLGTTLSLSIATILWMQGKLSIGTVYVIFSYTDQLSQPIQQIQEQLQDLQQAEACIQRIEELRETHSALKDGSGRLEGSQARSITFENICFGYSEDQPILHNLSFELAPGHVLGVVGHTGAGKTTLVRLLFRLYDPQAGEIRLDDVALPTLQLRSLRQKIGMVTQDVQLFHASVRDNLTLFNPNIPDTQILHALSTIGLTPWYQSLSEGLDSLIGSAGQGLSAGQAQLLAFARVFLANPSIIILDEASSRLDPATERLVEHAIDTLLQGRTVLIIAHRLSTIQRADEILVLEDGQISEYGSRQILAQDPHSRFHALLQRGQETVEEALTANNDADTREEDKR